MIPFSEKELEGITYEENPFSGPDTPLFNYPVTRKENFLACLRGEGYWVPTTNDIQLFHTKIVPCHQARGAIEDADPLPPENLGGKDMFGIEWAFDPVTFGSIVRPGNPVLKDANDWKEIIQFPDIDSWDWEASAKENAEFLDTDKLVSVYFFSGYFERLVSFMDFEGALIALIDEDQKVAVKELFKALTDLYIKMVNKYCEYFPGKIDNIMLHDDWGSSHAPFFSPDTIKEMLMYEPMRLVNYIKSKGIAASGHCCGNITSVLQYHVEIGYQMLEVQDLVDKDLFYENYADKVMLTYSPDPLPENPTAEQSREAARRFVDTYFNKGKKIVVEGYYTPLTTEFLEELYICSRKKSDEINARKTN